MKYNITIQEWDQQGFQKKVILQDCQVEAATAREGVEKALKEWAVDPAPRQVEEVFEESNTIFDGMTGNFSYSAIAEVEL